MLTSLPEDVLLERIITRLLTPDPRLMSINRWWRTTVTQNEELWRRAVLDRFSMFDSLAAPAGSLVAGRPWRNIYRQHALLEQESYELVRDGTSPSEGFEFQLAREDLLPLLSDITPVVDSRLSSFIFTFKLFDCREGREAVLVSNSVTISLSDDGAPELSIQICAPDDVPEEYRRIWDAAAQYDDDIAEFWENLRLEMLVTHEYETYRLTSRFLSDGLTYNVAFVQPVDRLRENDEDDEDDEDDEVEPHLIVYLNIDDRADLAEDGIMVTISFIGILGDDQESVRWDSPEEARLVALLRALRRAHLQPHRGAVQGPVGP